MSAWKKAFKSNQKIHKERHQPVSREHLGLLEKKKDYRLRAKDAEEKKKTLKLLHKKALNKNPDEFFHHMINSKLVNDEHHEKDEPDEHTKEQISLMETQDIKYITMKRTIETNKIKRLQAQLHLIDNANSIKNTHTFFVDKEDEVKNFNVAERLETDAILLDRKINRPRLSDLAKLNLPDIDEEALNLGAMKRNRLYNELCKRIEREKDLSIVQNKLQLKRVLKQKRHIKPKRLEKGTKSSAPIYEFHYERSK